MNYLDLINYFWRLDESWQFSCCETRLYFYILETANRLGWENSWTHSDPKMSANVGVSTNKMKSARNRLIQAGLIAVKSGGNGQGSKNRYQILTPKSQPKLTPKLHPKPTPKPQPTPIIDKLNKTITPVCPQKIEDAELPLEIPKEKFNEKDFVDEVIKYFNEHCPSFPQVKSITPKRHTAVMARFREHGRQAVFDTLSNAGKSKFLAGQGGGGWAADFNWIFKPENFVKVYEGNYTDTGGAAGRENTKGQRGASAQLGFTPDYNSNF